MKFESIISLTLRVGVISSSILVIVGLLLYYLLGYNSIIFTSDINAVKFLELILSGNPESLILLGVIILISTPLARVIELLAKYLYQKDKIYSILSLAVLLLMLAGILLLPSIG